MKTAVALLWLALLGAAIALSVYAASETPMSGDTGVLTWMQDQAAPGQTVSRIARWLETTQVVLAAGWLIAIGLWLARYRTEAVALAATMGLLALAQTGIKDLVDRPRPGPPIAEIRGGFSSPSFPSGHVMSATVFYGLALYLAWRLPLQPALKYGTVLVSTFAIVMAAPANVWVGVHWPSDVLGGYLWALVLLIPAVLAVETVRTKPAASKHDHAQRG
jgi:undecaprenyl-diphosphatase